MQAFVLIHRRCRVPRLPLTWTFGLAAAFGGFAGTVAALAMAPRARADMVYGNGHIAVYSFSDSVCTDLVDPISVVFVNKATTTNVNTHAGHHGRWTYRDGTMQYFYDHACKPLASQAANRASWGLPGRYHMRHRPNTDAVWGTYSLATPHYEDTLWCGHAVDSNWDEAPGGFVKAKWEVGYRWHNWNNGGGAHVYVHSEWWGNTDPQWQCDGQPAWNDGWTDIIRID
jgi:hypothetical protein